MFTNRLTIEKPPISRLTFSERKDPLSKKIRELDNSIDKTTNYRSEVGVNITTNERGTQTTYLKLSESKASNNSCHIGVSGWYNLDVIAIRRSKRGIIFDSNPYVALFLDHTFRCIIDSADRETFIRNMKVRITEYDSDKLHIPKNLMQYSVIYSDNFTLTPDLGPEDEVDIHSQNLEGWLANNDTYQFIRNLVLKNKIVVLTKEITNTDYFKKIHKLLEDNCICVDTLYVSNVHNYIYEEKNAFLETISCLSDENTLLIDSEKNLNNVLEQRITNYRELNSPEKKCERWFSNTSKIIDNKVFPSRTGTFFDKSSENKKIVCNYSVVFVMALLVAISAYLLNQSNQADVARQFQP